MCNIVTKVLLVAILCFCNVDWILSDPNTVRLKLRGVDCEYSCSESKENPDICKSSIMIDDKEYSQRLDGLNVAVIDQFTGNVEVKNFDQLRGFFFDLTKQFFQYFKKINDSSVVVIVSQNSCALHYHLWYKLLIKKTGDMFKKMNWNSGMETAVLVGCKGKCPKVLKGNLPYSYVGSDDWHSVDMKFLKNVTIPVVPSSTASSSKLPVIIGVCAGILFLIILILLAIYIRKRDIVNKHLFSCVHHKEVSVEEKTNLSPNGTIMFSNSSYNRQNDIIHISPLAKVPQKGYENVGDASLNVYESTKDDQIYDQLNYGTSNNTNGDVQREEPICNRTSEYCYVDPKETVEQESENTYYSPCNDGLSRARSETELTYLSASSADTCNNQSLLTCDSYQTQNIYYSASDCNGKTEYQPLAGGQDHDVYQTLS